MNSIVESNGTVTVTPTAEIARSYERALAASKRARWDLERDVLAGRPLEVSQKFLPDGLSLVKELPFLSDGDARFFSQVQGRTYANLFGLVERFISAKVLELGRAHVFTDQTALEALIRFSDEELKHQEMFRRVEALAARCMTPGYRCVADPNDVAKVVLEKSTWAVLALTCHIEHFTLTHYKESIDPDPTLSPLFKSVFRHHWMEESQHAVLDELEWRREDAALSPRARDEAVGDLLALVGAVDGILQQQAAADAHYFTRNASARFTPAQSAKVVSTFLRAYRYQYIHSGVHRTRFPQILAELVDDAAMARVQQGLAPLMT
jgi:hypothetical protein